MQTGRMTYANGTTPLPHDVCKPHHATPSTPHRRLALRAGWPRGIRAVGFRDVGLRVGLRRVACRASRPCVLFLACPGDRKALVSTPYTPHPTHHTLRTPYTPQPARNTYSLHATPCTQHATPLTLDPTPYTCSCLPRPSEKLIPSLSFPPTTESSNAPVPAVV